MRGPNLLTGGGTAYRTMAILKSHIYETDLHAASYMYIGGLNFTNGDLRIYSMRIGSG